MKPSLSCPCGENTNELALEYSSRPAGETAFPIEGKYLRYYKQCLICGHFFSSHEMCLDNLYSGAYSEATYGQEREKIFERIMNLPIHKSDNAARCERIDYYLKTHREFTQKRNTLLDIGSGLGVFPARMQINGWEVTALDPDAKAVEHMKTKIGCKCIHGDFMDQSIAEIGKYDLITFNKVLEHVEKPLEMLKKSKEFLKEEGIIYVEVPDGENAIVDGKDREEFFIEHHHVFSARSAAQMIKVSGLKLIKLDVLREASGKYTIALFCICNL